MSRHPSRWRGLQLRDSHTPRALIWAIAWGTPIIVGYGWIRGIIIVVENIIN